MNSHPHPRARLDKLLIFLGNYLQETSYSRYFLLMDENVHQYCYDDLLQHCPNLQDAAAEIIPPGEERKHLQTCEHIYDSLLQQHADRSTLLICLGGGVITDIGGFVAGTYKRGIDYINIPTTLLGMVDASLGGKTGVDFQGMKNMIGLFYPPQQIFLHPPFLDTLSDRQWLNGYAEALKHALIADQHFWRQMEDIDAPRQSDASELIHQAASLKQNIVEEDYRENGKRKALNFGHTIGHAIESYYLSSANPILHGEAVAAGIICESFLSSATLSLTDQELTSICWYLNSLYPHRAVPVSDYPALLEFMKNDKKNHSGTYQFALLKRIGEAVVDVSCDESQIFEALDYYNSFA